MLDAMADLSSEPRVAVALMDVHVDVKRKCQLGLELVFLSPGDSLLCLDG